jgi:RNA polymerase sigma-B factor
MTTFAQTDVDLHPELEARPSLHPVRDQARVRRAQRTEELLAELRVAQGDTRNRVLDELVAVNMPVAGAIASRYRWRGIATEDLEQVAYLALTKAAQRFDPHSGYPFLAFCVPTITGEIRRHFRDQGWMVRPPRRIQELQQRVTRAQSTLMVRQGRAATLAEIARELEETEDAVREALDVRGAFSPASLDRPLTDEGGSSTLGDVLELETDFEGAAEARLVLAPLVRDLSERDRKILRLRFFEGLTQREIAAEIGVTQMQVSRLLSRIFRDLRRGLGSMDDRSAS